MNKMKSALLLSVITCLIGCTDNKETVPDKVVVNASADKLILADFEKDIPTWLSAKNAKLERISNTQGGHSLKVAYSAEEKSASLVLKPKKPWDWDQVGDFNLTFDVTNISDVSAHLYVQIKDITGWPHTRTVSIPANSSGTYYAELKGPQIEFDSGLREDPPAWNSEQQKTFWLFGRKKLKLDEVSEVSFYLTNNNEDKTLVFDNIRLSALPEADPTYLENLADKFGQSYKQDFPNKVKSEAHLSELVQAELKQLEAEGPMADRSKFGGWKSGPKLAATGYFRTEKIDGKWAMVDPEGYLFFSSALANIRIANSTTLTGVDFKDDAVRYIDPEDVTPEDSLGIRPVSKEAQKTRYISSELRNKMFTWLPEYEDELANHYSYRRSTHKGPLKHGETFSFYQANLERRYGETHPDSYIEAWRDVTIKRFKNWGMTSTGNWTDASFYQMNRIPYFANGWIIGDFKKVSTGADVWGAMPDPFDPEFQRRAKVTTQAVADEVRNNPYCIGVFIDNEMSWGSMGSDKKRFSIATHIISREATDSPVKAEYMRLLTAQYNNITDLNAAWEIDLASWDELAKGYKIDAMSTAMLEDLAVLSEAYSTKYFQVVHDALAEVLPNHMYMGARIAPWGMTDEVIKSAKKYADVMSYNVYEEGLHPKMWSFLADVDMPSIIGEFHVGAVSDTGLYHPGLIHASDQKDRARMYKEYMRDIIDNPYMVGAHWFQYLDSPITGRAYDGENYNVGFVTIADVPYEEMVNAAKEVNTELYPRRFGK